MYKRIQKRKCDPKTWSHLKTSANSSRHPVLGEEMLWPISICILASGVKQGIPPRIIFYFPRVCVLRSLLRIAFFHFFFLQQLLRFVAQSFCLGAFTYRTNDIYARFLSYVLPFFYHSVCRVGIRLKKEGLMMLVAWFACSKRTHWLRCKLHFV